MRTTLDIEDDVLQAAKELARREGTTTGRVISVLARIGLSGGGKQAGKTKKIRNGVPVLPSRGDVVTIEHVQNLMDSEGV